MRSPRSARPGVGLIVTDHPQVCPLLLCPVSCASGSGWLGRQAAVGGVEGGREQWGPVIHPRQGADTEAQGGAWSRKRHRRRAQHPRQSPCWGSLPLRGPVGAHTTGASSSAPLTVRQNQLSCFVFSLKPTRDLREMSSCEKKRGDRAPGVAVPLRLAAGPRQSAQTAGLAPVPPLPLRLLGGGVCELTGILLISVPGQVPVCLLESYQDSSPGPSAGLEADEEEKDH